MAGVSGGGRAIWGNGESSQAAQGGRESSSWGSQACKESQLLLRAGYRWFIDPRHGEVAQGPQVRAGERAVARVGRGGPTWLRQDGC